MVQRKNFVQSSIQRKKVRRVQYNKKKFSRKTFFFCTELLLRKLTIYHYDLWEGELQLMLFEMITYSMSIIWSSKRIEANQMQSKRVRCVEKIARVCRWLSEKCYTGNQFKLMQCMSFSQQFI